MGAPCGERLEDFVRYLVERGRVDAGDVDAVVRMISTAPRWRERVETALEGYDPEVHWDWNQYVVHLTRMLAWRFGGRWRRGISG